jgi:hypothetical protein
MDGLMHCSKNGSDEVISIGDGVDGTCRRIQPNADAQALFYDNFPLTTKNVRSPSDTSMAR